MILCVWIDDIILAFSRDVDRERFATHLQATLPVDDRGALAWMLRMAIKRDRATCTLTISQEQYTKRLLERYLPAAACRRDYDTPLEDGVTLTLDQCPEEGSAAHLAMAARRADYMSIIGALLWLAAGTRPDITFATSLLARFCSNPAEEHYSALMCLLGYLRTMASRVLRFCPDVSREIDVYSDAFWATRNSVSGGVVAPVHGLSHHLVVAPSTVHCSVHYRSRILCGCACKSRGRVCMRVILLTLSVFPSLGQLSAYPFVH